MSSAAALSSDPHSSADAARHGLALYAEHTADARARPGAHPNIDRLLAIAEQGAPALSCEFEPA